MILMDPNLFGHAANVLFLCAYLVKDMLWLRAISIVACFIMILFNYYVPEQPLWVGIFWNAVFITVNGVRSIMLILERQQAVFSGDEQELYDRVFRHLSPPEFAKVLKVGSWVMIDAGAALMEEGKLPEALILICSGKAAVKRSHDSRSVKLSDGAFIGEMSLVTESVASANVVAETDIKAYSWPRAGLEQLFRANPNLKASFQLIIASDMAQKLKSI